MSARAAHDQHREYLTEHGDGLRLLPRVKIAIDTRFAQLVDADIAKPPECLRALDSPPDDPAHRSDWRRAAGYVERYRIDDHVTDQHCPLEPKPSGDEAILWQMDTRQLEVLTAQVRDPEPADDNGVELA